MTKHRLASPRINWRFVVKLGLFFGLLGALVLFVEYVVYTSSFLQIGA